MGVASLVALLLLYLNLSNLFVVSTDVSSGEDSLHGMVNGRCRCVCPEIEHVSSFRRDILNGTYQQETAVDRKQKTYFFEDWIPLKSSSYNHDGKLHTPPRKQIVYIVGCKATNCGCERVVLPRMLSTEKVVDPSGLWEEKLKEQFCPRCQCKYETRNTTIIKIVVIFVLCVITLLTIYMFSLLVCECFSKSRHFMLSQHARYETQSDETFAMNSLFQDSEFFSANFEERSPSNRSGLFQRMSDKQDKWKVNVEKQRKAIYDSRSMLN